MARTTAPRTQRTSGSSSGPLSTKAAQESVHRADRLSCFPPLQSAPRRCKKRPSCFLGFLFPSMNLMSCHGTHNLFIWSYGNPYAFPGSNRTIGVNVQRTPVRAEEQGWQDKGPRNLANRRRPKPSLCERSLRNRPRDGGLRSTSQRVLLTSRKGADKGRASKVQNCALGSPLLSQLLCRHRPLGIF